MKTLKSLILVILAIILAAVTVICVLGIIAYYMEPLATAFAAGAAIGMFLSLFCFEWAGEVK